MSEKRVYTFGNGTAEGKADMRNLLGGKGANLAEMNLIGVPVPPGFTITTDVCTEYYEKGKETVVGLLKAEVENSVKHVESLMNSTFGDPANPLLMSVRSGARASMPGMMDTILNLGLNDTVVAGLIEKTGNERFAYDSYRRFVQMYGDVVLGMKPVNKEDIDPFEAIIQQVKAERGIKLDSEMSVEDLKQLVALFKKAIKEQTGKDFPDDPMEQLWGAICAVFDSWMNERAILYRKMEGIPQEWGTAVTVQAMVFGNMGESSATGVCFSRDAGTGENLFNGEYLINAQGEDVVAGIRTPQQITKEGSLRWAAQQNIDEETRATKYPSMEEAMPELYKQLYAVQDKLEKHYHDMQDMEFTVQEGKLWFLQTRNGKRTGTAMVKIAMDLLHEGEIDEKKISSLSGYSYPMFSRLFSMLTEITLSEYIRTRRLTEAAIDLRDTDEKIIDIAMKYGYESPDAFGAAFKKFHGFTPSEVKEGKPFKLVSRIRLALSVKGGRSMDIKIEKKQAFKVAGYNEQDINSSLCPNVWDKLYGKYSHEELEGLGTGESVGICYDVESPDRINYMAGYITTDIEKALAVCTTSK